MRITVSVFYMHQLLERGRTPTEVCVFCFAFLNICNWWSQPATISQGTVKKQEEKFVVKE